MGKYATMDINQLLSSATGGKGSSLVGNLLGNENGLNGLINKLGNNGLKDQIGSWLGSGANQQVSPEQVTSALGPDTVANVASQAGVTPQEAAQHLAQALPEVIDKASPNGSLDASLLAGGQVPSQAPAAPDIAARAGGLAGSGS